jgi:hypothetical protein
LAAGAATLPFAPHVARAQVYPSRPVRIIVTFPAGGANDIHARLIGQWLSERRSRFRNRLMKPIADISEQAEFEIGSGLVRKKSRFQALPGRNFISMFGP